MVESGTIKGATDPDYTMKEQYTYGGSKTFVSLEKEGVTRWYKLSADSTVFEEMLSVTTNTDGTKLYNGEPKSEGKFYQVGHLTKIVVDGEEVEETGPLGPFKFLSALENTELVRFTKAEIREAATTVWYQEPTSGADMIKPGLLYKVSTRAGATFWTKLNFVSLMLALFFGTSALPHILIRYYTVSNERDRKSVV